MAVRKPLVNIAGNIKELPAGDSIDTGVGVKNTLSSGEVITVPAGYQFHVHGKLRMHGTAILRTAGEALVV